MASSGLLCLKWNNHTSAFDKLLNNLHLRDIYSDGTIVCHGKFYPVHRFVLSTCSEYFEEIFRQSINMKSKHPFIIVKDIHPPQMEALLNYMYRGEVNVPQEMLPDLIKAAEAFKIKGLAVPDDEPPPTKSSSSRDRKRASVSSSPCPQMKKSRRLDDAKSTNVGLPSSEEDCSKQNDGGRVGCNNFKSLSTSNPKETEELYITDNPLNKVKSEPLDIPEYNDGLPDEIAHLDDFKSPKEHNIKEEKTYESFATAEQFPTYDDDLNQSSEEPFDMAQSSSWDNSQGFEEDINQEENESAQGISTDNRFDASTSFSKLRTDDKLTALNFSTGGPPLFTCVEKRLKCNYCVYTSNSISRMKDHLTMHTGEKPYACPHCPHRASDIRNLRRHILTHTGEKPFQCPSCPYRAARNAQLRKHVQTSHSEVLL